MIRRWAFRVVAGASAVVWAVVVTVDLQSTQPSGAFYIMYGAVALTFVGVGLLIVERQPANTVGALILVFGFLFATFLPADLALHRGASGALADLAATYTAALDAPMFILLALTLLLFPDGQLPSPRWRWVTNLAAVGIGLAFVGYLLEPGANQIYPTHRSPVAIDGFPGQALVYASYMIMIVLLVAAAISLIRRWRRGGPVLRAQVKWVVAAALILLVLELLNVATFRADDPNAWTTVLASVGIALVPLAMAIAILRYHLFDIDRLISRTLSYGVVMAILAMTFGLAIVVLQALLQGVTQGQTVAVAASTLAVFALFQPVLRRVRRTVDRRFDRARYDGDRTADAFAQRLRHETDMATVTSDLARTAADTVAPTSLAIWLRTGPSDR